MSGSALDLWKEFASVYKNVVGHTISTVPTSGSKASPKVCSYENCFNEHSKCPQLCCQYESKDGAVKCNKRLHFSCALDASDPDRYRVRADGRIEFYCEEHKRPVLYCICKKPFSDISTGPLLQCENCLEWYHFRCMKLEEDSYQEEEGYVCPPCEKAERQLKKESGDEATAAKVKDKYTETLNEKLKLARNKEAQFNRNEVARDYLGTIGTYLDTLSRLIDDFRSASTGSRFDWSIDHLENFIRDLEMSSSSESLPENNPRKLWEMLKKFGLIKHNPVLKSWHGDMVDALSSLKRWSSSSGIAVHNICTQIAPSLSRDLLPSSDDRNSTVPSDTWEKLFTSINSLGREGRYIKFGDRDLAPFVCIVECVHWVHEVYTIVFLNLASNCKDGTPSSSSVSGRSERDRVQRSTLDFTALNNLKIKGFEKMRKLQDRIEETKAAEAFRSQGPDGSEESNGETIISSTFSLCASYKADVFADWISAFYENFEQVLFNMDVWRKECEKIFNSLKGEDQRRRRSTLAVRELLKQEELFPLRFEKRALLQEKLSQTLVVDKEVAEVLTSMQLVDQEGAPESLAVEKMRILKDKIEETSGIRIPSADYLQAVMERVTFLERWSELKDKRSRLSIREAEDLSDDFKAFTVTQKELKDGEDTEYQGFKEGLDSVIASLEPHIAEIYSRYSSAFACVADLGDRTSELVTDILNQKENKAENNIPFLSKLFSTDVTKRIQSILAESLKCEVESLHERFLVYIEELQGSIKVALRIYRQQQQCDISDENPKRDKKSNHHTVESIEESLQTLKDLNSRKDTFLPPSAPQSHRKLEKSIKGELQKLYKAMMSSNQDALKSWQKLRKAVQAAHQGTWGSFLLENYGEAEFNNITVATELEDLEASAMNTDLRDIETLKVLKDVRACAKRVEEQIKSACAETIENNSSDKGMEFLKELVSQSKQMPLDSAIIDSLHILWKICRLSVFTTHLKLFTDSYGGKSPQITCKVIEEKADLMSDYDPIPNLVSNDTNESAYSATAESGYLSPACIALLRVVSSEIDSLDTENMMNITTQDHLDSITSSFKEVYWLARCRHLLNFQGSRGAARVLLKEVSEGNQGRGYASSSVKREENMLQSLLNDTSQKNPEEQKLLSSLGNLLKSSNSAVELGKEKGLSSRECIVLGLQAWNTEVQSISDGTSTLIRELDKLAEEVKTRPLQDTDLLELLSRYAVILGAVKFNETELTSIWHRMDNSDPTYVHNSLKSLIPLREKLSEATKVQSIHVGADEDIEYPLENCKLIGVMLSEVDELEAQHTAWICQADSIIPTKGTRRKAKQLPSLQSVQELLNQPISFAFGSQEMHILNTAVEKCQAFVHSFRKLVSPRRPVESYQAVPMQMLFTDEEEQSGSVGDDSDIVLDCRIESLQTAAKQAQVYGESTLLDITSELTLCDWIIKVTSWAITCPKPKKVDEVHTRGLDYNTEVIRSHEAIKLFDNIPPEYLRSMQDCGLVSAESATKEFYSKFYERSMKVPNFHADAHRVILLSVDLLHYVDKELHLAKNFANEIMKELESLRESAKMLKKKNSDRKRQLHELENKVLELRERSYAWNKENVIKVPGYLDTELKKSLVSRKSSKGDLRAISIFKVDDASSDEDAGARDVNSSDDTSSSDSDSSTDSSDSDSDSDTSGDTPKSDAPDHDSEVKSSRQKIKKESKVDKDTRKRKNKERNVRDVSKKSAADSQKDEYTVSKKSRKSEDASSASTHPVLLNKRDGRPCCNPTCAETRHAAASDASSRKLTDDAVGNGFVPEWCYEINGKTIRAEQVPSHLRQFQYYCCSSCADACTEDTFEALLWYRRTLSADTNSGTSYTPKTTTIEAQENCELEADTGSDIWQRTLDADRMAFAAPASSIESTQPYSTIESAQNTVDIAAASTSSHLWNSYYCSEAVRSNVWNALGSLTRKPFQSSFIDINTSQMNSSKKTASRHEGSNGSIEAQKAAAGEALLMETFEAIRKPLVRPGSLKLEPIAGTASNPKGMEHLEHLRHLPSAMRGALAIVEPPPEVDKVLYVRTKCEHYLRSALIRGLRPYAAIGEVLWYASFLAGEVERQLFELKGPEVDPKSEYILTLRMLKANLPKTPSPILKRLIRDYDKFNPLRSRDPDVRREALERYESTGELPVMDVKALCLSKGADFETDDQKIKRQEAQRQEKMQSLTESTTQAQSAAFIKTNRGGDWREGMMGRDEESSVSMISSGTSLGEKRPRSPTSASQHDGNFTFDAYSDDVYLESADTSAGGSGSSAHSALINSIEEAKTHTPGTVVNCDAGTRPKRPRPTVVTAHYLPGVGTQLEVTDIQDTASSLNGDVTLEDKNSKSPENTSASSPQRENIFVERENVVSLAERLKLNNIAPGSSSATQDNTFPAEDTAQTASQSRQVYEEPSSVWESDLESGRDLDIHRYSDVLYEKPQYVLNDIGEALLQLKLSKKQANPINCFATTLNPQIQGMISCSEPLVVSERAPPKDISKMIKRKMNENEKNFAMVAFTFADRDGACTDGSYISAFWTEFAKHDSLKPRVGVCTLSNAAKIYIVPPPHLDKMEILKTDPMLDKTIWSKVKAKAVMRADKKNVLFGVVEYTDDMINIEGVGYPYEESDEMERILSRAEQCASELLL